FRRRLGWRRLRSGLKQPEESEQGRIHGSLSLYAYARALLRQSENEHRAALAEVLPPVFGLLLRSGVLDVRGALRRLAALRRRLLSGVGKAGAGDASDRDR